MYGKPAITCFKYQVFMYGLKAITYLNATLWVATEPSPHFVWRTTFTHLKEFSCMVKYFKKQGETCMVQKPSHVQQLSPIHVCKIGLQTT